jgi:hypothetical protein
MTLDNLTAKQSDYAIFLPALSSFYSTYIGKQRGGNYVDPARMPANIQDMEMLNWLNDQKSLFPYKWSLYSAGHANLDLTKQDWGEDMVRNRDRANTFLLGDSGGFQIGKGKWEGDWKNPNCPKAQKKREQVLAWMDGLMDYGMCLDIPTWITKIPSSMELTGIKTYKDAVNATYINNDYFINNRSGDCKFLNVLQGEHHTDADRWYNTMKKYCDPRQYPGRHFNGWAMGGQNMCDIHLVLKRLVALRFDGLLEEGKQDWMHFLGTSKLEWALLLTDIQRAVRKYHNPAFTISFDCASPFLATANGQVYHQIDIEHHQKWCYRMRAIVDDKKYASDTRSYRNAVLQDNLIGHFDDSPISSNLQIKDICIYKPGDLNKIGKEGKTSWDSFSYALLMGHNVWTHISSVQEANRQYDLGLCPDMLQNDLSIIAFKDVIDSIFATDDRDKANDIIDNNKHWWRQIIGTRGATGKKTVNPNTMFDQLYGSSDESNESELDETKLEQMENNT